MIIDKERVPQLSSLSSTEGRLIEMVLKDPFSEIGEKKGSRVILAAWFVDSLVIVIGEVIDYKEFDADPSFPEQYIFAKLTVSGQSISISIGEKL